MAEMMTLRMAHDAALRMTKGDARHPGMMGTALDAARRTHLACALHGPTDHFYPIAFDGRDGREEWLRAYETVDLTNGPQNPMTAEGTYLVRFADCEPAGATFKPLVGRIAVYVHTGAVHLMVGHSPDGHKPPFCSRTVLAKGSRFELVQPGTWWALAPSGGSVLTVIGMRPNYDRIIDDVRSLPSIAVRTIAQSIIDE